MILRRLLLWFYCLPIWKAVMLLLAATVAFRLMDTKLGRKPMWKAALCTGSLLSLGLILFITVSGRTEEGAGQLLLTPFQSYRTVFSGGERELLRSNFMNVVLFYPAGLMLASILPKKWHGWLKAVLIFVLLAVLSVGIEWLQYHRALGQAETDDVIHNALGALLGALAGLIRIKPMMKKE